MSSVIETLDARGMTRLLQRARSLPPAVMALALQLFSFGIVFFLAYLLGSEPAIPLFGLGLGCGALAACLSAWAGLPIWWIAIQFMFAPALLLGMSLQLNPNWFLAIFLMLIAIYWSTFRSRIPLYLSSQLAWQEVAKLLPEPGQFRFLDLGSGLGSMLDHLAQLRPEASFFGIETAPLPFFFSRVRLFRRKNCSVFWGSFWKHHLGDYDVIYAYLSPVPMEQLWHKAKTEMKPGSLLISNTFIVPGVEPNASIRLADFHGSTLYLWRM